MELELYFHSIILQEISRRQNVSFKSSGNCSSDWGQRVKKRASRLRGSWFGCEKRSLFHKFLNAIPVAFNIGAFPDAIFFNNVE